MAKSPDAFRTISEVADWLGIQAHVLRFWESKFTQVKPIKRAGGRRYYRPGDMQLLGGIKKLLHDDGLTIKGVQKILREDGIAHVVALSQPLDELTAADIEETPQVAAKPPAEPSAEKDTSEKDNVLRFGQRHDDTSDAVEAVDAEEPTDEPTPPAVDTVMEETPAAASTELPEAVDPEPAPIAAADEAAPEEDTQTEVAKDTDAPLSLSDPEPTPADMAARDAIADQDTTEVDTAQADTAQEEEPAPTAALPAFLRRPLTDAPTPEERAPETKSAAPSKKVDQTADAPAPPAPKPRNIDMPKITPEAQIAAKPSVLSTTYRVKRVDGPTARNAAPLLERLETLRKSMSAQRRGNNPSAPGA